MFAVPLLVESGVEPLPCLRDTAAGLGGTAGVELLLSTCLGDTGLGLGGTAGGIFLFFFCISTDDTCICVYIWTAGSAFFTFSRLFNDGRPKFLCELC